MSLAAVLVGVALLLVSIPIVAGPLINKKRFEPLVGKRQGGSQQGNHERALLALRDLDFDHHLGVVSETDYRQLRPQLMAQAAEVYEQTTHDEADLEQIIETAVHDRRQHISDDHVPCPGCGATLDPFDKYCAACGRQTSLRCPQCQQLVEMGDRFCAACGARLPVTKGTTDI